MLSFELNKRDISLPELVRGKLTAACRRWHVWVSRADSALTHLSVVGNLLVQLWCSESSQTTQTDGSKHKTATSHQSTDTFTDNKNRPVSVSLVIFLIQAVLTEKRLSHVFMSQILQIKTHISVCSISVCDLIVWHGAKCCM